MGRAEPKIHRPIDVLAPQDAWKLVEAFEPRSWIGCRARVLACLLWRVGLRANSARHIRPCDVNLETATAMAVAKGPCLCPRCQETDPPRPWAKGWKDYTCNMDPQTVAEIRRFLPIRAKYLARHGITDTDKLSICCTRTGLPMADGCDRRLLRTLQRRAKLTGRRIHPHGLRHALAHDLSRAGARLGLIAKQLGHRNAYTTEIYLNRLNDTTDLADMMHNRGEAPRQHYLQILAAIDRLQADHISRDTNPRKHVERLMAVLNGHETDA